MSAIKSKMLLAALLSAGFAAPKASAEIVMLNAYTIYDYTVPGDSYPGALQFEHLVFDTSQIDPKTHRVPLLLQQHDIGGHYAPAHVTPEEHMEGAWLDMSSLPYRYHRWSKATHGATEIVIDATENGRISMRRVSDLSLLVSGRYWVDPTLIHGAAAVAAGTPGPNTMPEMPKGTKVPGGQVDFPPIASPGLNPGAPPKP